MKTNQDDSSLKKITYFTYETSEWFALNHWKVLQKERITCKSDTLIACMSIAQILSSSIGLFNCYGPYKESKSRSCS